MSTDYRATAASSHWWILPPAITEQGEIDHERLISRVNKFFGLTAAVFFTAGPYALIAPSALSCSVFFGPILLIQSALYLDEFVAESVAAKIQAKKEEIGKNPPPIVVSATRTATAGHKSLHKRVGFAEPADQEYSTRPLPELAAN
jgi:hypothetical protein